MTISMRLENGLAKNREVVIKAKGKKTKQNKKHTTEFYVGKMIKKEEEGKNKLAQAWKIG